MIRRRVLLCAVACFVFAASLDGRGDLSKDQLKMLQDPDGWQYVTVSDEDAGVQTKHVCFDGRPHPEQCSGTLKFNRDHTFVQSVHIHGKTVERHGTYRLNGGEIGFFDEFGTQDGPYMLEINTQEKSMTLGMPQLRIELELEDR